MEKNARIVEETNENYIEGTDEPIAEFQYRLRTSNGEYRWFHTFGTVFSRDDNNKVEHILNISLDITEKIKAEQILLQKTTRARAIEPKPGGVRFYRKSRSERAPSKDLTLPIDLY